LCETVTPDHVPEIVTAPLSSRAREASPTGAFKETETPVSSCWNT
jgi:hypothetical protein